MASSDFGQGSRKRPRREKPAHCDPPEHPGLQPDWARQELSSAEHPEWGAQLVRRLICAGILARGRGPGSRLKVQVWSDCGGLAPEIYASRELGHAVATELGMDLDWRLYCHCDRDAKVRQFVQQNYHPTHSSDDITKRNFQEGRFWCSTCSQNHDLPTSGIDLYVGGYARSPWSRRGLRSDFDHPDMQAFYLGIETVRYMKPALWLYGTAEGVEDRRGGAETSALDQVLEHIAKTIQPSYITQVVRHVSPTWHGYPVRRPGLFLLSWRPDAGIPENLVQPLHALMQEPLPLLHNYATFLKLQRKVDWSRVDEYPTEAELGVIAASESLRGCACGPDPMVPCPRHPCGKHCRRCGRTGTACLWRRKMVEFAAERCPSGMGRTQAEASKLTYVQVMAMHGLEAPSSPRQRNLLNVLALLPQAQPLNETLLVADLGQSVDAPAQIFDGSVPAFLSNSALFCFRAGAFLTTAQKGALMGYRLDHLRLEHCSEAWLSGKLGSSVHVANMGAMLMALVAPALTGV